ncbi:MAG: hypothetical protein HC894_11730 [Microcoleus sp. SM1_3_4]|nr:hypothetical protein [Microcoleus sp. SM1_3_4]
MTAGTQCGYAFYLWIAGCETKQPTSPKNLVALSKAAGTASDSLTAKLYSAVWRPIENCNILCGRPALLCRAGRLDFGFSRKTQKKEDTKYDAGSNA